MAKSVLHSNPIRKLRKLSNMTAADLANVCNVSEKAVYYSEHGVYEFPLESISAYFANQRDINLVEFNENYTAFRHQMRQNLRRVLDNNPSVWRFSIPFEVCDTTRSTFETLVTPIADFRVNSLLMTKADFIKSFLVNDGLLSRLEAGRDFKTLPTPIANALVECGAPKLFMDELHERTIKFCSTNKRLRK